MQDRIEYFERMLADNPDSPTGLLALANEYDKVGRYEDETAVLERYIAAHKDERTDRKHPLWIRFTASLTGDDAGRVELTRT